MGEAGVGRLQSDLGGEHRREKRRSRFVSQGSRGRGADGRREIDGAAKDRGFVGGCGVATNVTARARVTGLRFVMPETYSPRAIGRGARGGGCETRVRLTGGVEGFGRISA